MSAYVLERVSVQWGEACTPTLERRVQLTDITSFPNAPIFFSLVNGQRPSIPVKAL
jgi:hypothetical protein